MSGRALRLILLSVWLSLFGWSSRLQAQTPATPVRSTPASVLPPSPAQTTQLGLIQMDMGETQQVTVPGIQRFLVANPEFADVQQIGPNTLRIAGRAPGRTTLQVWGSTGRSAGVIQVFYPQAFVAPAHPRTPEEELYERSRPLTMRYDVRYENLRRGTKFSDSDKTTSNLLTQSFNPEMETPYGEASGYTSFTRSNELQDWTTWQARLDEGHIGPLKHFDAVAGDTIIPFGGGFAVPSTSYRGGTFIYRDFYPYTATAVWGRQRSTAFGTSSLGASSNVDSFLGGGQLAFDEPKSPWTTRYSALFGYGQDRTPEQADALVDLNNRIRVVPPLSLESEVALNDNVSYGYTVGSNWSTRRTSLRMMWRQVERDFNTIVGPGGYQGERGISGEGALALTPTISLNGDVDWYNSKLFFNPAEPDAHNLNMHGSIGWNPGPNTSFTANGGRRRDDATIAPSHEDTWGVGGTERLSIRRLVPYLTTLDLSGSYNHDQSRSIPTPALDFESENFGVAAGLPLPLGFGVDVSHTWRVLRQVRTGEKTLPRSLGLGLSNFSSIGPFGLRGRIGYDRDRESGAVTSFLPGQDRLVGEAGITFNPWESAELFADGRAEHIQFESGALDSAEFGFFTGARIDLDTKFIRWDPATSVRGVVFNDLNGDRKRQPEEPGIKGMKVVSGIARRTSTDKEGRFSFWRVAGKAVPISLDLKSVPKGYVLTTPRVYVVKPGQKDSPRYLEFGVMAQGEVRGRVYYDVDANKRSGPADRGLEGVKVRLDNMLVQTDRSGWFFFRNLGSGVKTITLVLSSLPVQYLPTVPVTQQVTVPEGGTAEVEFPTTMHRALEGRVFVDTNKNGRFDGTPDSGLPEIPMCLDGRRVAKTDTAGSYRFPEIGVGEHSLLLNCGIPMRGYLPLSKAQQTVTIRPDDPQSLTVDFRLERLAVEAVPETLPDEAIPEEAEPQG